MNNFEEYIRQGEPHKKEKGYAWQTAIGLQAVDGLKLKHRPTFLVNYINPAIKNGFIRVLYPENPKHPRQKYLLTAKGMTIRNNLNNQILT